MDLKIRPRADADEDALLALELATERFHAAGMPERCHERSDITLPPAFPTDMHREILVAECDGLVAGFLDVRVQHMPEKEFFSARTVGFVVQIVVAEEQREHGIGRALMDAAAAWARDLGCNALELNVFEFNARARHFYEQLGYETQSRILSLKI